MRGDVLLLEASRVKGIEVVDCRDAPPLSEQRVNEVTPDKPGPSRHQRVLHRLSP
jgi:hypothetical protein